MIEVIYTDEYRRGEHHHKAKLTTEQVMEIRASNDKQIYLASKYGVDQAEISRIRNGRRWRHL